MAKQSFSASHSNPHSNEPHARTAARLSMPHWQSLLVRLAPLILLVLLAATTYYVTTSARSLVVGSLTELPAPDQTTPRWMQRNVKESDTEGTELMIATPSVSVFQPHPTKIVEWPVKTARRHVPAAPQ